jgi:hypothetical protein
MVLAAAGQWIDVTTLPEVARLIEIAEFVATEGVLSPETLIEIGAAVDGLRA